MSQKLTVGEALDLVRQQLKSHAVSDSPSLDAQAVLEKVTGMHRPALLSHSDRELSDDETTTVLDLTNRLLNDEPLPYILGKWEFFGNPFIVTPDVLIPRPETELLVDEAIRWIGENPAVISVTDIGTGSGCIALSILNAYPDSVFNFFAVDISLPALRIAKSNAKLLKLGNRIRFIQSNLSYPLAGPIELVCANLPYIPSKRCKELDVAKTEPIIALDGGFDGFEYYRQLFFDLQSKLALRSLVLCEIEYSQKNIALTAAKAFFPEAEIMVKEDLSGMPRLLSIRNQE
ncbi:MAG: peptide chain release factor N(5)-glutamine methyltransferase [Flexilinea sp.]